MKVDFAVRFQDIATFAKPTSHHTSLCHSKQFRAPQVLIALRASARRIKHAQHSSAERPRRAPMPPPRWRTSYDDENETKRAPSGSSTASQTKHTTTVHNAEAQERCKGTAALL